MTQVGSLVLEELEVLESVVVVLAVEMMDDLLASQGAVKVPGDDEAMFEYVTIRGSHFCETVLWRNQHMDVAARVFTPATLPVVMSGTAQRR